jgi:hypothetical protein
MQAHLPEAPVSKERRTEIACSAKAQVPFLAQTQYADYLIPQFYGAIAYSPLSEFPEIRKVLSYLMGINIQKLGEFRGINGGLRAFLFYVIL